MSAATSGRSPAIGVDVLFEIPNQPTPAKYVYQAIDVPIGFTVKMGGPTVHCDWLGTLATYLNQGWKLVEVFLDQSQQQSGAFSTSASMNSVWFFEKELHKLQDPTPVYQGAVLEYFHKISQSFGGVSVKTDWTPVIVEMGKRGWELACIQETPEMYQCGFGKVKIKLIMFFQRRIITGGTMMSPPPYPGPPPSMNPPDQSSTAPYSPEQPAEKQDPPN
ncbi:raftlin-like [Dendronephthya gigantea]|uniref:raftlin-like n=1 Tax=Dendronephthya gigantea TaxID=151771 RepID=UPI001069B7B2|nr:raftlin-like [Dendronephthya gigantea]